MTENTTQAAECLSRLTAELGTLKEIISRVADELGLPTENGNRVHDLQFWLDNPKPTNCTDDALFEEMKAAAYLANKADGELDYPSFARGFANRVLMKWGSKEGVHKALMTPFTNSA